MAMIGVGRWRAWWGIFAAAANPAAHLPDK
jgi:hypothetical protein